MLDATIKEFEAMCYSAEERKDFCDTKGRQCAQWNTFHTLVGIGAGFIGGSALFVAINEVLPSIMLWIGLTLAMVSTGCSLINAICRLAEKAQGHKFLAQKWDAFLNECTIIVAIYLDESESVTAKTEIKRIDQNLLHALDIQRGRFSSLLTENVGPLI